MKKQKQETMRIVGVGIRESLISGLRTEPIYILQVFLKDGKASEVTRELLQVKNGREEDSRAKD